LHKRIADIDVHLMLHVITLIIENSTITKYLQSFGGYKRDMRDMALCLPGLGVELVVMESTGIYWKSQAGSLSGSCVIKSNKKQNRKSSKPKRFIGRSSEPSSWVKARACW
jgi:transposase